jgi:hypothetical protein
MRGLRFGGVVAALAAGLVCVPGALSAPPSNDHFANAAVLAGEVGTSDWTNLDATKESTEPDHAGDGGGRSIWFSWVAPRAGQLLFDTCDSAIDTLLAVYTGAALDDLDLVVASDDECENRSAVELAVSQGEALRIAVDGKAGAVGAINIWWRMRPANDDFADAQVVSGWDATVPGSNILASHELNEPLHAEEDGAGSVWYRWTAPGPEAVQVNTCESTFDTILAVYRGTSLADLVEVAANDDQCGAGSVVNFAAIGGETYYIAVDGFDATSFGSFALRLLQPAPKATRAPTVTGRLWEGETLTGDLGQWSGAPPLSFEFWWEGCGGGECYALPFTKGVRTITARALQTVRFVVKATNNYGSATAHSEPVTVPVVPTAMVSPPSLEGRPLVGEILTVNNGQWSGTGALMFSYQWERCEDRPLRCLNINTSSSDFYLLTRREVGFRIRARVVAHGHGGFAWAHTPLSGVVLGRRVPQQVSCLVPRLKGKTLKKARSTLSRARCRLGKVLRVRSARRAGVIVGQTPRPGTRLRAGGRVSVRVSKGRRR